MPSKYIIDKVRGRIFSIGWDVVSSQELMEQARRVLSDPDFDPHYRQLWDLTDVIRFSATFPEMMAVAQLEVFAPATRRAILAPSNATFGLARMFQMLCEARGETGIHVFRDRTEALRWLEFDKVPVQAAAPASRK
jgi:hypothetical protein